MTACRGYRKEDTRAIEKENASGEQKNETTSGDASVHFNSITRSATKHVERICKRSYDKTSHNSQSRIKTKFGLMLLPTKEPFLLAFTTDLEVQHPWLVTQPTFTERGNRVTYITTVHSIVCHTLIEINIKPRPIGYKYTVSPAKV